MFNALWNCKNPFQGDFKKVLCVCSAGLLRSPTTALVLSQNPFNFNTRAAGIEDYALIKVDQVLLTWADEIICMNNYQKELLISMLKEINLKTKILCLDIPDSYSYRDTELMNIIMQKCKGIYVS